MCDKVDEHAAVAKYNVTPIDTKWVGTDTAFQEEPLHIHPFTTCCRRVQQWGQARLVCGKTPPLDALNAIIYIAASHSPEFSLMHVDFSRAYFHAKA